MKLVYKDKKNKVIYLYATKKFAEINKLKKAPYSPMEDEFLKERGWTFVEYGSINDKNKIKD